MKRLGTLILKNSVANLARGAATATAVILLPRFLTRLLDPSRFDAWVLMLQIASYASFLDFGLGTAVARFFAQASELAQTELQKRLVSTAFVLLSAAAMLALAIISVVLWGLPRLFHGVPAALLSEFRMAALLLSLGACLLLPLSTYTGVLTGLHRNEIPALSIGGTRIIATGLVVWVAHLTDYLPALALCFCVPPLLGGIVQGKTVQRLTRIAFSPLLFDWSVGRDLIRFSSGLLASSVSMLFVSGLDLTIVGHFRFSAVGYFAIASTLISFFSGLTYAGLNALITPLSTLHARHNMQQALQLVFAATRLVVLVNSLLTAGVFLFGGPVLRFWVGPIYAESALPVLKVLAVAQTIRLIVGAYGILLVSVGEQSKSIGAATCEAGVNLFASIIGAMIVGPMGVAYGTLIGALSGVLWTLFRVMPSIDACKVQVRETLRDAVLPGMIPSMPFAVLFILRPHLPLAMFWLAFAVSLALAAWLTLTRVSPQALFQDEKRPSTPVPL